MKVPTQVYQIQVHLRPYFQVTDEVLFKFYKQLGLYEDEKQQRTGKSTASAVDPEVTELFDGDLKKFVNETLVARQHYLKRERVNTGMAK